MLVNRFTELLCYSYIKIISQFHLDILFPCCLFMITAQMSLLCYELTRCYRILNIESLSTMGIVCLLHCLISPCAWSSGIHFYS